MGHTHFTLTAWPPPQVVHSPGLVLDPTSPADLDQEETKRLRLVLTKFQRPSSARALWQILNTFIPYALLWFLMWHVKEISLWLAVPLAVLTGCVLVRVFIFFHDCGHGSFLKARWANDLIGFIAGMLTFTPYYHWRWQHGIHHGTSGHLDKRGVGDVWTWTVQEYLDASRWKRFSYRFVRNPFTLFVIAPLYVFLYPPPVRLVNCKPARTSFGMVDEPGIAVPCCHHELVIRHRHLRTAATHRVDGRRCQRHLALLYPAPVRRRVLGAR